MLFRSACGASRGLNETQLRDESSELDAVKGFGEAVSCYLCRRDVDKVNIGPGNQHADIVVLDIDMAASGVIDRVTYKSYSRLVISVDNS